MFQKKNKHDEEDLDYGLESGLEPEDGETADILTVEDGDEEIKPKKKKLPGWVIVPILAAVLLVFFGASKLLSNSGKSPALPVVAVERGDVKEVYNSSGNVESERTKVFFSPVNAPVQVCNAKVGQTVKAGELLVVYNTADLEKNNQESQLNALSTQYTNQATAEESQRSAQTKAEAAAQSSAKIGSLRSQIQEKEAALVDMRSNLAASQYQAGENAAAASDLNVRMQENMAKQSELSVQKETSERELNNFEAAYPDLSEEQKKTKKEELVKKANDATARLEALKAEYKSYEQAMSGVGSTDVSALMQQITAAEQEVSSLRASLTELENSGSKVSAGLTNGQANSMQVSENLAELTLLKSEELVAKGKEGIKAEFDGIISDVKTAAGTDAVQGGELFTLVSNKDVNVKLEVSANDFNSLKTGSAASIKLGDREYQGTLKSIDKIALPNEKGTPVIGAYVRIDNPDDAIYIGVNAKVKLNVAEKKNVLCLPNEVVNTSSEGDFVYLISNGEVKKKNVELGVASGSRVEILDGLKEGDQVVSDVSGTVKEGMKAEAALKAGGK